MSRSAWVLVIWTAIGIVAITVNAYLGFPVRRTQLVLDGFLWAFALVGLEEIFG